MRGAILALRRVTRGLRFRLTLTYILLFAALLGVLGVFFGQTLRSIYAEQTRNLLEEEWGAVRGYLRIERGKINWYYDRDDPEEALIVDRLQQVYILTDSKGEVKQRGPRYGSLHVHTPEEIKAVLAGKGPVWREVKNSRGEEYLLRESVLMSEDNKPYFIVLGRSFAERDRIISEFARSYGILLPLMIFSASVLGWFVAGRALAPVNEVASTAQQITGSNLSAAIPLRGADDELDRLIESFNHMIERLDASFSQTRQFSTDVSHELRTPLTAIRGQLEVALMSAKTPEQYQDAVLNALEDVERLSKTIRALLLLSQAESGQLTLQREGINLTALIDDFVEQFQIPAEGARVTLTSQLAPNCIVEADRIQLERLVSNLLSNAVKYTPEGGSINVALEELPRQVQFTVSDTGVGIAPDHLPHIFDRFYRVPNIDSGRVTPERGLGLGLSFVAWIVKAHRGTIDVRSSPGQGTALIVRLPKGPISESGRTVAPQPSAVETG